MNPWTFCAGAPIFISSEATGLYLLPMKFQNNIRRIVSSMEGIIILNELLDIKRVKGTQFAVWNCLPKVERTPLIEEEAGYIECSGLQLPMLVERELVHCCFHPTAM